jgi:hypothetical protein
MVSKTVGLGLPAMRSRRATARKEVDVSTATTLAFRIAVIILVFLRVSADSKLPSLIMLLLVVRIGPSTEPGFSPPR